VAPAHGTGVALSLATALALVAAAVSCLRLGRRFRPARALGSD
jgi:hypothetical protein